MFRGTQDLCSFSSFGSVNCKLISLYDISQFNEENKCEYRTMWCSTCACSMGVAGLLCIWFCMWPNSRSFTIDSMLHVGYHPPLRERVLKTASPTASAVFTSDHIQFVEQLRSTMFLVPPCEMGHLADLLKNELICTKDERHCWKCVVGRL